MRQLAFSAVAAFVMALAGYPSSQAAEPEQPLRWVLADNVRVRSGPSLDHSPIGALSRGATVTLMTTKEEDGFCVISGEGQHGFVACKYLSADHVARPKAGADGIDEAQRWVSGNGVTLREAPHRDAPIIGRMELNTVVKLLRQDSGSGYCEVQAVNGQTGFTACRYLALTPAVLAHIRGYGGSDQPPPADYDPERAFWLEPSWEAMMQYAEYLKRRYPDIPPDGPWPRDDALERMKAHLALGLKGRRPDHYVNWLELKRKASADMVMSGEPRLLHVQGGTSTDEIWRRKQRMQGTALELQRAIGISGPLHDAISTDGGAERIIHLVRALEFPIVDPSLFRSEAELAPPRSTIEEVSGRFGIVFRQLVIPRTKQKPGAEDGSGLYDIRGRTQLLVRPIQYVQLFRDGRLNVKSSLMRTSEIFWHEVDEPMCSGWAPGFSFGDAEATIWRGIGEDAGLNSNPRGSVFAFYTNMELARSAAVHTQTSVKLDRNATGFIQGMHLYYDLNADGTPDLAIWEGQGKGPGHLDGPTMSDDRWYRLVLANIGGAWKVLGSDVFSYGCGC